MTLSNKSAQRAAKSTKKAGKKAGKKTASKKAGKKSASRKLKKISSKLLEMLVCPVTHTPLRYDAVRQELISDAAGLAFPIRDGVPIMLVKEARIIK